MQQLLFGIELGLAIGRIILTIIEVLDKETK
jgi:hypothetical protein